MERQPEATTPLLNNGQIFQSMKADESIANFIWRFHVRRSALMRKLKERGVYDDLSFYGLREVPCEGPGCSQWIEIGSDIVVVLFKKMQNKYVFCSIPCQRRHYVEHNSNHFFQGTASRKLRGEELDDLEFDAEEEE